MNIRWKTGAGTSLIIGLLVFVCLVNLVYKARQFARSAPEQATTVAYFVYGSHYLFDQLRFDYYSCDYDFTVNGEPYSGNSDCPQDPAGKGRLRAWLDPDQTFSDKAVTVYYDPGDPSLSSLKEFKATSARYYRDAIPWIALEILVVLSAIFFALLDANEKKASGAVFVDTEGTVIYPGEITVDPNLDGECNGNGKRETPSAAVNGDEAEAADFASPPSLREIYLEVVNQIHPDRAASEPDLKLRERLMKDANAAFARGDAVALRKVQEEYRRRFPANLRAKSPARCDPLDK